jgi:flagellin
MANIGATTALYKVETALTKANTEVSKSMERLATGRANANAGDRSSYVAMGDTFRLDFVGAKAALKSAAVVQGYLETGMRVLDSAAQILSRIGELAVLGANDTNTAADFAAIDSEAEALGDEFHRLLSSATYKGKGVFVTTAGKEFVAVGGRSAEMSYGIQKIEYSELYLSTYAQYAREHTSLISGGDATNSATALAVKVDLRTRNVREGALYEVTTAGNTADGKTVGLTGASDAAIKGKIDTAAVSGTAGDKFTAAATGTIATAHVVKQEGQLLYAASEGMGESTVDTNMLLSKVEAIQKLINKARVQAGSQYAAIESAVSYATDLTAQYELGFNAVNDVNFSMETAHLAKNQILQQAATAMLAQANSGQQGLLQLINN